jgi:basic amino acid/polyamine antiporter, APA family
MQPPQPQTLPRVIGPWVATAIVVGTVIGSGVFKKGRNVADNVPEVGLAMAVWALGGLLALLGALALAEVAVLFPKSGGNYVFLREGYGRPWGFLWGWVEFWIIRSASIGALATMFTESFHDILKQALYPGQKLDALGFWPRQLLTVSVIAALAAVNARGTRLGGGVQFFITLLKVGTLLFIVALPFAIYAGLSQPILPPRAANLSPLWPGNWGAVNWSGFGVALVGVLWAYHGWMNIAPIAGEVKEPQRNIPLALFAGVFVLIALYCGANLAYYFVVPRDAIVAKSPDGNLSDTPLASEFCQALIGPAGLLVASAIIMTSVFGSLNGNLLVGPRLLYAMAHDRLAPRILGTTHPRYETPFWATVALAGLACLQVLILGALIQSGTGLFDSVDERTGQVVQNSPFDVLTNFAIFGSVTFETLAVASIFMFRRMIPPTPENRPYRCLGYPFVPALYIAIMSLVLVNFFVNPKQRGEAFVGLGFIALGALVYAAFLRERKS